MATIIERDTSSPTSAVLIFMLFAMLIIGGFWFAYTNGMIGRPTIIENNKTVVLPGPAPAPAK